MGRAIRWQALIAFLGIVLLAAILASTAHQFTSVTVPASGGVYTEAAVGSPRGINPLLGYGSDLDRDLTGLIFQGLVSLDERGEAVPALAESWEISPDQLDYTFHLRQDIRWHDGAPFTAADVVYTVGVVQSDAFAAADFPAPSFLSQLWRTVTVEQLDDYTVRFRLQQPYAPFLYENTIGILPAHLWSRVPVADMPRSALNLEPVGTGPWRLVDLSAVSARLEPNPYWDGPAPYLEAMEFRFYPDYPSAFAALAAGEVEGVSRIVNQDMALARDMQDLSIYTAPLAGETFAYFNLANPNTPFFADKQVRQALWLALDLPDLVDRALDGQGIPADGPLMPGTWAYSPQALPKADPRQAAEMLTEAGWVDTNGDGVRDQGDMPMAFILLGDDEALLNALAQQWAAIGVWAKPQVVNLVSLAGDYLEPRNYEAAVVHWQLSGDPDPYPLWHSTQIDDGQNYAGWNNRRADELMEQGRSVSDPGRRAQLYQEFQAVFADELPALPLYFDVYNYGVSDEVRDVQIGRLNSPWERFRTADQWYVVTQRVTVEPGE
ncbi:MAG: ABC transporter substrate-binding protein [Anaerolineae bacterium]